VLESLAQTAQQTAEEIVCAAIYGAVAALWAAVGLGFFIAAAYLWAQDAWGAVIALCALGGFYLLLALAILLLDRSRRRAKVARQSPEPLLSPTVVGAVTEVFRMARAEFNSGSGPERSRSRLSRASAAGRVCLRTEETE
jgi:hypothetical protein